MKNESALMNIPVDKIQGNTQNPRRLGNNRADAELVESVRYNGILMPILVRPVGTHYTVVAGERRLQAAKLIGLETIPALVRSMDDEAAYEAASTENLVRADMNPADECEAVRRMVQDMSRKEVALRFGRSMQWVATREKVAELGEEILQAMREGDLSMGAALHLAKLHPDQALEVLHEAKGLTEEHVERLVGWRLRDLADADWGMNEKLTAKDGEKLPVCSWCTSRTDKQVDIFGVPSESVSRCTDEACWKKKQEASLLAERKKREKEEAKRKAEVQTQEPDTEEDDAEDESPSPWAIRQERIKAVKTMILEEVERGYNQITTIGALPFIADVIRNHTYNTPLQKLADDDGVEHLIGISTGSPLKRALLLTIAQELMSDDIKKAIELCKTIGAETERMEAEMEALG